MKALRCSTNQPVAALMLGAAGVQMGTRFIATQESTAPAMHKEAILKADSDQTTVSDAFTGAWARLLRSQFITEYRAAGAPVLPPLVQQLTARDIYHAAATRGDPEHYPLYSGQGVGMVKRVERSEDVLRAIIREAEAALSGERR